MIQALSIPESYCLKALTTNIEAAMQTNMQVIIIGGSLIGLMHGIMLKHHGHTVTIFEKSPKRLGGQAAGIGYGGTVRTFLDAHDRLAAPIALPTKGFQYLDIQGKIESHMKDPRAMTTWDALYLRLRANFDEFVSDHNPDVTTENVRREGDGTGKYLGRRKVVRIEEEGVEDGGKGKVIVRYEDISTGQMQDATADLVIGADGANSTVRKLLCPTAQDRKYAGYVMWRGIVPEQRLSAETMQQCADWFSICCDWAHRDYVIVYPIPGKTGSLFPGDREMNFAWYSHISSRDLSAALTDTAGHRHQWSVPLGKLDPVVWQKQLRERGGQLNPACAEIAAGIKQPFLQVIGDQVAPRATFLGGKVLLVGDALVTIRPHTGLGINNGAAQALRLERVLFGEEEKGRRLEERIREWEREVLGNARLEWLKSISWGEYYMGGWMGWVPAAVRYYGLSSLRAWWAWAASRPQAEVRHAG